ncbi:MAG: hypothetical protein M1838_001720 [Thelocarpon superellum]|nr:MAG: hypothetical protein M1838_001720 [Thelocarpon superellum]
MSDAQQFLLAVDRDKNEAARIADGTARQLENKQVKLLGVVQSLGDYLTDDDATIRAKAVAYFAAVLGALEPRFLTRQQIAVTVQFFCDRIHDASGLREAAEGLAAVQRYDRFSGENAVQVATALFTGCPELQQHPQGSRFVVLTLLNSILAKQREALKGMGGDFVVGITDLVNAEKDPRNLMVVFSMLHVVMVEWNISEHTERMFDAVFCYFPITFRPPPDDPYGITAQDLKGRLRECIAASSDVAGHAFPALLEKLDSTSPNVKKDVLQTISACAASYTPFAIATHSTQLWDSIKFEILNAQDEELASEALTAVGAIAKRLSFGLESAAATTPLARYVRSVTTECTEQLREPNQKQAKPVGQILEAMAQASELSFGQVIKNVMGPLLTAYKEAGVIRSQHVLLEVLVRMLDAALHLQGERGLGAAATENPLDGYRDRLFELSCQALMGTAKEEVSFRIVALNSLLRLAQVRELLVSNEIGMIVQYLDEILLGEDEHQSARLKDEAVTALVEVSKFRPDLILDVSFPAFLATLPETEDKETNQRECQSGLAYLARISVEKNVFEVLLRRLANRLLTVIRAPIKEFRRYETLSLQSPKNAPINAGYAQALLATLLYSLGHRDLEHDPNVPRYSEQLVIPLMEELDLSTHNDNFPHNALEDEAVLDGVGKVVNIIIRALPGPSQLEAVKLSHVWGSYALSSQSPAQVGTRQTRKSIVSSYILGAMRPEHTLPSYEPKSALEHLTACCLAEKTVVIRLSLLRQLCLVINKWMSPAETEIVLEVATTQLEHLSQEPDAERGSNTLRVLFWMAKALVLRTDKQVNTLIDQLLTLLDSPQWGHPSARLFSILLAPDDLMTRANFVSVRLLHKQRLFAHCAPRLASAFRGAPPTLTDGTTSVRSNYLIALSGLLKDVSSEIVLAYLDTLLPLLLQSLDLSDVPVKAATLQTLTVVIQQSPGAVESHVSSLIARLLSLTEGRDNNKKGSVGVDPPRLRQSALAALSLFPAAFRGEIILPVRAQVLKRLLSALDDPKRGVRKTAVDCRAVWARVGDMD